MSELCSNCTLRSELCDVQAALGPLAAEAAVVGDVASTFYRTAAELEKERAGAQETARLELHMHDSTPPEARDPVEGRRLAKSLVDAVSARVQAAAMKHDAEAARAISHSAELNDNLSMAVTSIRILDHVCTKGPKTNGDCRAPYSDRRHARKAFNLIRQVVSDHKDN